MADWIACPGCGLKHSARPDGICPRCRATVGLGAHLGAAAAAPGTEAGPAIEPPPAPGAGSPASAVGPLPPQVAMLGFYPPGEVRPTGPPAYQPAPAVDPLPLGARVAGLVLLANALVALVAYLMGRSGGPIGAPVAVGTSLVDVVVAVGLLSNRSWARTVALVRAVLGGLIFMPWLWMSVGPLFGLLQLVFTLGILALLTGETGPLRLAGGLAGSAGALALILLMTLSPPLGRAVRALAADLSAGGSHLEAASHASGATWRLPLPPGRWHEPAMLTKDLDGGASWPEEDAHLVVMSRPLPAGGGERAGANLGVVADRAIRALAGRSTSFTEKERVTLHRERGAGLAIHAALTEMGQEVEAWLVVIVEEDRFAFVGALAPADRFEEVGGALLQLAGAIEL